MMVDRTTGWVRRVARGVETWELGLLGAETIQDSTTRAETQHELNKLQTRLNRMHKKLSSLIPGQSPRELVPVTDVNEKGELVIVGYRIEE